MLTYYRLHSSSRKLHSEASRWHHPETILIPEHRHGAGEQNINCDFIPAHCTELDSVMKKKTAKVTNFIEGLHEFIVSNPQFRSRTSGRSETQIQTEIRPLIIQYLEKHYQQQGFKDPVAKANKSFYWEGQEGEYGNSRATTFGSRNYPDFIVTDPYLIAIEYKQSANGSTVKQGIGQSIMHTLCEDFH